MPIPFLHSCHFNLNRGRFVIFSLAVICMLFASFAVDAQRVKLTMKDGRVLDGELIRETSLTVVVQISGINTTIRRDSIQSIEKLKTLREEYEEKRAEIADDDKRKRYELALWLFDMKTQEAYQLAQSELNDLRERFPDDRRIRNLLNIVNERLKLNDEESEAETENDRDTSTQADADREESGKESMPLLRPDEIALIKVWELPDELDDLELNIRIPRLIMKQVFRDYSDNPAVPRGRTDQSRFLKTAGHVQLNLLFELEAREYYPDVVINGDPPSLVDFRRRLYRNYITNYFIDHFGKGQIEGVRLAYGARGSEAEIYTNFYLLCHLKYKGQLFIDRNSPEKSLLLQWGLPLDYAEFPAPAVARNWRPRFSDVNDRVYQELLHWIENLRLPQPEYGIDYPLPQTQTETTTPNTPASAQ